ncbi:MAG: class I SAM-dependent methyltransferase [Promethearchaeota archaeon]
MARKNRLPEFPDDYLLKKAEEYNNSKWMKRNQNRTTLQTIKYLYDKKLEDEYKTRIIKRELPLILDLGCGTGFSSEILIQNGFRVIGIDILDDMILKAREKKKGFKNL